MNKPDVRLVNTVRKLLREKALLDHAEKDTKTHAVLLLLSFALDAEELHDARVRDIVRRAARVTSDDSNADDFNAKLAADAQALIRDYPGSYPTAKDPSGDNPTDRPAPQTTAFIARHDTSPTVCSVCRLPSIIVDGTFRCPASPPCKDPSGADERSKNEGKPTETTRSDMADAPDAPDAPDALDARLQRLRAAGIDSVTALILAAEARRAALAIGNSLTAKGLTALSPTDTQEALAKFIADDPDGSKQRAHAGMALREILRREKEKNEAGNVRKPVEVGSRWRPVGGTEVFTVERIEAKGVHGQWSDGHPDTAYTVSALLKDFNRVPDDDPTQINERFGPEARAAAIAFWDEAFKNVTKPRS